MPRPLLLLACAALAARADDYVEPWDRGLGVPSVSPPASPSAPGLIETLAPFAPIGLAVLVAIVAYFALRKLVELVTADVYAGGKRALGSLFGRRNRAPLPAGRPIPPPIGAPTPAMPSPSPTPPARAAGPEIRTPGGLIHGLAWLADGEECKVYSARLAPADGGPEQPVVLKLPASDAAAELLREEAATLEKLAAEARQYAKHLPRVLTRFRMADRRLALVLERSDGLTLSELRRRFPHGIEPRHLTWIFRRSLSVLGYAHSRGVLHGNLTPDHLLVRPSDHNLWLLDWTRAVADPQTTGQHFRIAHPVWGPPEAHRGLPALPASDLYSLALCMVFGLGAEPGARQPPDGTPEPLARLLDFMLKESPVQRPQDAWALYNRLETIRDGLFGPHRFVELVVP